MKFDLEVVIPGRNNSVLVTGDDGGGSTWTFTQPLDLTAAEINRFERVFDRLKGQIISQGSNPEELKVLGITNFSF